MTNVLFKKLRSTPPSSNGVLRRTVLREFGGGWNVIDNDLSLNPEYSTIIDNLFRKPDGSLAIRHGTKLFADITDTLVGAVTVNMTYFQDTIVSVATDGRICYTDGAGTTTLLWDHATANALASLGDWAVSTGYVVDDVVHDVDLDSYWKCLVGHTSVGAGTFADDRTANPTYWEEAEEGWSTTDFVSFAQFKGELIICNGTDKPLVADLTAVNKCQYLADAASGSNINTPIARYVYAGDEFLMMAGNPTKPTTVHISNQGSAGTWVGDGAPNNAVDIDLASIVPSNNDEIKGLSFFRDTVVVGFDTAMVLGTLGIFDGSSNHTPDFGEVVEAHGCLSHRSMVNLGDDMLFMDNVGVPSLARTLLTETIRPDRPSELIDPAIQANLEQLAVGTLSLNTFAVYNLLDKLYMMFVPNHDSKQYDMEADSFAIINVNDTNTTYTLAVTLYNHGIEEDDSVTISGATGFNSIQAATLNTTHTVDAVIDQDTFVITVTDNILDPLDDYAGGGSSATLVSLQTRTTGYVYHSNVTQSRRKKRVWTRFIGWNWSCGCRSVLGKLFFTKVGTGKIFYYGSDTDKLSKDHIGDTDDDITFEWELPWTAFGDRYDIKKWRYLGFDTRGSARFTVETYVDDIYKNYLGERLPNNSADFLGGDSPGYGSGTQPFGGGRMTNTRRNYAWTLKAKLVKLRVYGTTDQPLRIISVIVGYQKGSI